MHVHAPPNSATAVNPHVCEQHLRGCTQVGKVGLRTLGQQLQSGAHEGGVAALQAALHRAVGSAGAHRLVGSC